MCTKRIYFKINYNAWTEILIGWHNIFWIDNLRNLRCINYWNLLWCWNFHFKATSIWVFQISLHLLKLAPIDIFMCILFILCEGCCVQVRLHGRPAGAGQYTSSLATHSTLQNLDLMHTTLWTIVYMFVKEAFALTCRDDPWRNFADHVLGAQVQLVYWSECSPV